MLNIYKYHTHPERLPLYDKMHMINPDFFWEKYKNNPEELKKREGATRKPLRHNFERSKKIMI